MREFLQLEFRKMNRNMRRAERAIGCCLICLAASAGLILTELTGRSSLAAESADLVLRGGAVVTMDREQPRAESVACRNGEIVAVGSVRDVDRLIGETTRVVELNGRMVAPGFIEGHGHYVALGRSKLILDLTTARQWSDIVEMVKQAAGKAGSGRWIVGRGWHQSKWTKPPEPNVGGYPTHDSISKVTPRNPVLLTHASGHMSFANQLAMTLSEIDANTADPIGGEIMRGSDGKPIGVFREAAQNLILEENKSNSDEARELAESMKLAAEECLRNGITSFHDAGSSFGLIDFFREYAEQDKLQVRLWVMIRASNASLRRNLANYRRIDSRGFLTVRAIKRSIDGALGPHGAWLLEPYADLQGASGFRTASLGSIQETARLAAAHRFQLCVHAIGDRANRAVLDQFEEAFSVPSGAPDRRWRIEHAQHLHPGDIPRFAEMNVIASMQGIHCTSDAPFVVERLGKKRAKEGAYVWQSLLKSGAVVINGTDAPVEKVDPIASFYASVTRRLPNGRLFFPEQRMTRKQALRSYTIDAAYAAFEEDVKGSVSVGKLADLVVLSNNLLDCPDDSILKTRIDHTIVNGKIVYSAGDE
jgi:predicted amidohydrolase YtcJ